MSDLLTILTTDNPCNKVVRVIDGKPVKKAGKPIVRAEAQTVRVANVMQMVTLLGHVADHPNKVLVQGYADGTISGERYQIMSKRQLGADYSQGWVKTEPGRAIARLKTNFKPSSWWQLDRDFAPGIPALLSGMSDDEWVQAVDTIMPGFARAGFVRVASTSGRVLHDGKPLDATGCRYWFQIEDPSDGSFGERLKLQALTNGLGFAKPNKNGVNTPWAIFDPTVFSWERIVYDGKPSVFDGLTLRAPDITFQEGGRVDTSLIKPLDTPAKAKIKREHGLTAQRNGSGALCCVQTGNLQLDTRIQTTRSGFITPREFHANGVEKVRCQATFRESNSWNGFLYKNRLGMPVLFDNGTRTRYELSQDQQLLLAFGDLQQ